MGTIRRILPADDYIFIESDISISKLNIITQ
jgi:hypothetical protein